MQKKRIEKRKKKSVRIKKKVQKKKGTVEGSETILLCKSKKKTKLARVFQCKINQF